MDVNIGCAFKRGRVEGSESILTYPVRRVSKFGWDECAPGQND